MAKSPPSYWDYLGLDQLLHLQHGLDANEEAQLADELNFIVARRTRATLFLVYERHVSNTDAPPVPQAKPRPPHIKRRAQRPSRKPRRLPNYR